jgi:hypothetical protein
MWLLSDAYVFPIVQAALVLCFIFVFAKDANLARPGDVTRASESMEMLGITVTLYRLRDRFITMPQGAPRPQTP